MIITNLKSAHKRFSKEDHHKLYEGAVLNAEVLNSCSGVSAPEGSILIIDNSYVGEGYWTLDEEGKVEHFMW